MNAANRHRRRVMMADMLGVLGVYSETSNALAFLDRPTPRTLIVAILATAAGWAYHQWAGQDSRIGASAASSDRRPEPIGEHHLESPAVVALLTNGFRVPSSAINATVLDLAARGWLRLGVVNDELVVVTRGQGATGDTVRTYEQQVLNHVSSRAFNDVASASTLASSQHRLDARWRRRFAQGVSAHAASLGLSRPRWTLATTAPAAGAAGVALIALAHSATRRTEASIADTWPWWLLLAAASAATIAFSWQVYTQAASGEQVPTPLGELRAAEWMGYRRRLRARIPGDASVLAAPQQQAALALASVMGVAESVHHQLPVDREDARWAWSEAGETPHAVRVRYPIRPGYGQHPLRVAGVGLVVLLLSRWAQGYLERIADEDVLESALDKIPGQIEIVTAVASVLAKSCWVPIVWGLWSFVAGVVDSLAIRERVGMVARTRRPDDVAPLAYLLNPLADRDRSSTYLAIDDGARRTVTAWLASERTTAPQGAQARVRATPLLGYVRSSEPIGTATRSTR